MVNRKGACGQIQAYGEDLKHMFGCGKIKNMDEKNDGKKLHISRADILLAGIFGVLALGLFAVHKMGFKEGECLVISWEGAEVEWLSLKDGYKGRTNDGVGTDRTRYCQMLYTEGGIFFRWFEEGEEAPKIPEGISYNTLKLSKSGVFMEASDCPDQICVHHSPVSASGENIICLPHKLVVEIRGKTEEDGLDGMVK